MINLRLLFVIISLAIVGCFLFPTIKIGSTTSVKPDWFFAMMLLPFVFKMSNEMNLSLTREFLIIAFLIIFNSILSEVIGTAYYLQGSAVRLPTTGILILNKITIFIFFIYCGYKGYLNFNKLNYFITAIFLIGLLFGLMQYFEIGGAADIATKYYLEEDSVQSFNFSQFKRIIGTAPAIITWGGCSVLIFHYFLFIVKNRMISIIGCSLAVLNVLMAASRAAIISLIMSFILIQLINSLLVKKSLISALKILAMIGVVIVGAYIILQTYIPEQFEFLEKRFDNAEDAMTVTGRGSQLDHFWKLLTSDPVGMVFGIGTGPVVEYGYLELDPAYIFVAFGLVGFILHYTLIYLLIKFAFKHRHFNSQLFLFIVGSPIGYLIFSIGFYFFYELYMGYPYWWLNGLIVGYIYKSNLEQCKLKIVSQ